MLNWVFIYLFLYVYKERKKLEMILFNYCEFCVSVGWSIKENIVKKGFIN